MTSPPPTRRERIHAETVREIRDLALRQVDDGGLATLSLNAIAKEMGMSGPALYRYFASRDALLGALHTEAYGQLVTALREAGETSSGRAPMARLSAYALAYRGWALKHPRRYALLFGERPATFTDPTEAISEIHEGMLLLLRTLADVVGERPHAKASDELERQLTDWARRRNPQERFAPRVLRLGVLFWTRLHGIVSLELSSIFKDMGLDGGVLLQEEVKHLLDSEGARR
ncbi:TetR/AcrR family transcriptional regulator [Myxococcaceae bacterium JPH2]|nr:TetR/AcrR family transcriptional regulator [Myxococcaceae bacterium JPH2]